MMVMKEMSERKRKPLSSEMVRQRVKWVSGDQLCATATTTCARAGSQRQPRPPPLILSPRGHAQHDEVRTPRTRRRRRLGRPGTNSVSSRRS